MKHETARLLPAIRSYIGDWIYYNTVMTLPDIAQHIKNPSEVHECKALADWIQREHIQKHSDDIAEYLKNSPQRFLGSLIIGVYGGEPMWSPIEKIDFSETNFGKNLDPQKTLDLEGKIGVLVLSGNEKLFAIDGQHRVFGIKTAIENNYITEEDAKKESVAAVFVAHNPTSEGKKRTRRLFSTVNQKAKRVARYSNIALDEDDGFAIITRDLVDTYHLFVTKDNISFPSSTGSLPSESNEITSIVGLYNIVMDLHPRIGRKLFREVRPSDKKLESHRNLCEKYFDILLKHCPEYKEVFSQKKQIASYYKKGLNNHLLFRPAGQRAFAQAVEVLISRETKIEEAVKKLLSVDLHITKKPWHKIAWDPIDKTMITNKRGLMETHLLQSSGDLARNKKMGDNYQKFIKDRRQNTT